MRLLSICCLLVLAFFHYSEAIKECKCRPQHPQEAFCDDKTFVIKAKILSRKKVSGGPGSGRRVYKVKVLKDYKNTFDPIQGKEKIYTSSSHEPCGVYFRRKATYIISGYKSGADGKLTTSACSWSQKICTVTSFQKFALKTGLYKKNCQCKILDCTDGNCNPPTGENCVIKSNRNCYLKKNACVQKSTYGALQCGWKSNTCDPKPDHEVNKEVVYEPVDTEVPEHVYTSGEHVVHKLFNSLAEPEHFKGPEDKHIVIEPYTKDVYENIDHVRQKVVGF
ncbi:metalloproteinase inhibitor 2-like [Saccostrea echinata]|uniref:metalloproteinase inhibitor 2-like n=1 Tax=Saccostrea echinata TaxID=191078 RepID=UPI002A7EEBE8|nr:metalloproteinase inhibitor 2-like [Saccostrea echinata]